MGIQKILFTFLSFIPIVRSYYNIHIEEQPTATVNAPITIPYEYSVTPVVWDPTQHILPFCVELNNNTIETELIEDAIDNVNAYLFSGTIEQTALYFKILEYKETGTCPENNLKIRVNKINNSLNAPGYCSRRFVDGTIERPYILYSGCDIDMNVCALQSSAMFYNVLLHELLHVIGLDHPSKTNTLESVMAYSVTSKNVELTEIKQDTNYITIQPVDAANIRYIIERDFPTAILPNPRSIASYIPDVSPGKHISGSREYIVNEYMNVNECWIHENSPTVSPTGAPTGTPTGNPTITISPKGKGKKGKRTKGKGKKRKGKKGTSGTVDFQTSTTPKVVSTGEIAAENISIDTKVNPKVDIDALYGDIRVHSDISPVIRISGDTSSYNFNVVTEVNPVIRIKKKQRKVGPSAQEWDRLQDTIP